MQITNAAGIFVLGEPDDTDLYRLIRSAIDITQPNDSKQNISMSCFIDADTPRIVEAWEQHLKAVPINTLGNSVKYTDSGSVTLVVRPLTQIENDANTIIRFEITDTGIGIPPAQFETIYEPFAIGDDSRGRKFEGTGLGLAITKQYLDEMRGKIEIRSVEGAGSVVEIEVPVKVIARFVEQN